MWVLLWWKVYRRPEGHPKVSKAEQDYINSDSVAEAPLKKMSWWKVLPHRETWAFSAAKITDAVWWFYLFWGGKFLYDKFGLNIKSLALPLIIIYVLADGGSVAGGWLSSFFIKKGWTINRSRKTTMFICACCILPVMFVTQIKTAFRVDTGFFDRLQQVTFATERVVTVNGQPKKEKTREHVPLNVQTQMHALEGKSYPSARAFITAAADVLTAGHKAQVEAAMPQEQNGSYEVTDAFADSIRQNVSPEAADSLRAIHGQQFKSREAFVDGAAGAIGKAEANRLDNALLSSARVGHGIYWIAVLLIALGAAGHQAWSANIFTLVSDVFPKKATASVTGIGGMVGAVAGILGDAYLGKVLTTSGPAGYFFAFLVAGSCYLILLGVVHLLMPRMTPLDENLNRIKA
jgi:hypothetical protein